MKDVYLIGGTMGVGKTAVCQSMKGQLDNSVFLDGDWCWDAHPFQVTDVTKRMVMENICFLLNNFIRCPAYGSVIFSWVMHDQAIIDEILSRVETANCKLHVISLVCTEAALVARLRADVEAGKRTEDVIAKSLERLPLYDGLNTVKVDVSSLTAKEAAEHIIRSC